MTSKKDMKEIKRSYTEEFVCVVCYSTEYKQFDFEKRKGQENNYFSRFFLRFCGANA